MFTAAANRKYTTRTVVCWAIYLALSTLAAGEWSERWGELANVALGAAVALPVAGHVWATWILIQQSDEFARAVALKRSFLAWGICMVAASAWGFAELSTDIPHAPGLLIYPLFWVAFFAVSPFVNTSR